MEIYMFGIGIVRTFLQLYYLSSVSEEKTTIETILQSDMIQSKTMRKLMYCSEASEVKQWR